MPDGLAVGQTVEMDGFFTQAKWLRGRAPSDVERRIGYRSGRLRDGWYLMFLMRKPSVLEFELRGMSYMSGGVEQGHLPDPPDPRTAERRLGDDGFNVSGIKKKLVDEIFRVNGPGRLCKVVPIADPFGDSDYPPGSGIPQWILTRELPFRVAAVVGPRQTYSGTYG